MKTVYMVFLIRTDTTKEGVGNFDSVYNTEEEAKSLCKEYNTQMVLNASSMYIVEPVQIGKKGEGFRLNKERHVY